MRFNMRCNMRCNIDSRIQCIRLDVLHLLQPRTRSCLATDMYDTNLLRLCHKLHLSVHAAVVSAAAVFSSFDAALLFESLAGRLSQTCVDRAERSSCYLLALVDTKQRLTY